MMKNLLYISFVAALLITSGCKKTFQPEPYPTQVSGRVLETKTHIPIKNATVTLLGSNNDGGLGGVDFGVIATTLSDSAGNYTFPLKAVSHSLSAGAPGYWETGFPMLLTSAHMDIELDPTAILRIHLVNEHPYNENDAIGVSAYEGKNGLIKGTKVDTILSGVVIGNDSNDISWGYRRDNGDKVGKTVKLYCPAHKTSNFEIRY